MVKIAPFTIHQTRDRSENYYIANLNKIKKFISYIEKIQRNFNDESQQ